MEDDLVYAGFLALPLGSLIGLYLFFVKYRQHKNEKLRWWKLLAGNLLVLLFAGSLATLLGETYFRFWYDTTDSFSFSKTSQRWFERHWHVNQWGFRDEQEYSRSRSSGKRRVTFIGDSFTAGHGIRDVNDRFANRIRNMHPDWEVHVLAKPALDSGAELNMLYELAQTTYEFDQVVLVYCLNDISDINPTTFDSGLETPLPLALEFPLQAQLPGE